MEVVCSDLFDAQDMTDFFRYCNYMTACFCHAAVPTRWHAYLDLIDHRYFYNLEGRGWYTCGLARNAVAEQLHKLQTHFADTDFLKSLAFYIDIPPVAGFMIEHALLSSIRSNGLAIGAEIGNSMELRPLDQPPTFNLAFKNKPVLYRPNKSNFKAIDGMIVLITQEKENARENTNKNAKNTKKNAKKYAKEQKPKLFMYPLQITLASSHSDSHAKFFEEYNKWATELS